MNFTNNFMNDLNLYWQRFIFKIFFNKGLMIESISGLII
jgi:hypothetical protein